MVNCIFLRNSNGNLYVPYLNWNGDEWYLNFNRLGNDWNDNDRLVSCQSLHSLPFGGVLFIKFHPPIYHSTHFCKRGRQSSYFIRINSLYLPQKFDKKF